MVSLGRQGRTQTWGKSIFWITFSVTACVRAQQPIKISTGHMSLWLRNSTFAHLLSIPCKLGRCSSGRETNAFFFCCPWAAPPPEETREPSRKMQKKKKETQNKTPTLAECVRPFSFFWLLLSFLNVVLYSGHKISKDAAFFSKTKAI